MVKGNKNYYEIVQQKVSTLFLNCLLLLEKNFHIYKLFKRLFIVNKVKILQ